MEGVYINISTECKRRSLSLAETLITERSPDEFQTAWRGLGTPSGFFTICKAHRWVRFEQAHLQGT
jgi:hypothetical protein